MSVIHRFKGAWGRLFTWDGARTREYKGASQATETWLIGKAEGAENFAMRYYELGPGGHSREEDHPYDHGVIIIRGAGEVLIGEQMHPVGQGDVVYIAPDARHQMRNTGDDTLGWICVIPARRQKEGRIVWAEEGLEDQLHTT
jgi:quercetin dioxygenase-like cupin family protein